MRIKPPLGLISGIAGGLVGSWRVQRDGWERAIAAVRQSPTGGVIYCLWHQGLIAAAGTHRGMRVAALASRSGDGDIIAAVIARLGLRPVRGSSARGAVAAARELMDAVDEGWQLAIAVDGPRGPFKEPKAGPLEMARRHGVPLVPIACRASAELSFKGSWDRFRVPLPWARVAVVYGEPLLLPPEEPSAAELEARRRRLALGLHAAELRAGAMVGRGYDARPPACCLEWLKAGAAGG